MGGNSWLLSVHVGMHELDSSPICGRTQGILDSQKLILFPFLLCLSQIIASLFGGSVSFKPESVLHTANM